MFLYLIVNFHPIEDAYHQMLSCYLKMYDIYDNFKVNWCETFNSFVLEKLMCDSMRFIILSVVLLGISFGLSSP